MRNRKAGKQGGDAQSEPKGEPGKSKAKKREKKQQEEKELPKILVYMQWFAIITVMVMPVFVIGYCYRKWGPNYFLPDFMISLTLTEDEWREVFKNRTLVMIGGPHRGGTTVLWDAVRQHPKITDFGDERQSGLDFSEGVFAQSVYPTHGVGNEFQRGKEMDGVGRYALRPEEYVHRKADHETVSVENQLKVLNKWGYLWDMTDKPILLEKSPVNAVMSTFLQALFNANNNGWESSPPDFGGKESFVKFIFTSRDPMANAYAQRELSFNKQESLERLLLNWLTIHEYLAEDIPGLQHVYRLTAEDFDKNAAEETAKIWKWLGLEEDEAALEKVKGMVESGQNAKYVVKHCEIMLKHEGTLDKYLELADMYNDRVMALGLGYDLKNKWWSCEFVNENNPQ